MNAISEIAYREAIDRARQTLESKGYQIKDPQTADLPSFLEGRVPDLIATKGEGGVIVGIRTNPPLSGEDDKLTFFSDVARKQAGWRFDLYLARPRQELLDAPLQPGRDELVSELKTAGSIASNEGAKAALIYAWALLESVARLLALNERRGEAKRYQPSSVITSLVSEGFLEDEDAELLYQLADARNRVVHGFTKTEVDRAQVDWLLKTIAKLIGELPAA
jgi:uncharacterized protein YutE (UPF0331/DUF86 family)